MNYGVRWEYFALEVPPRRRRPAGSPQRAPSARSTMPTWNSVAPRVRRGLRPVRQPEDRGQVQRRQVHAGRARPASPKPTTRWRCTTAHRVVDRRQRRRRPAGRAGLRLRDCRDAGLRDQPRAVAERLRCRQHSPTFDPDIKRMYNIEETVEHPARAAAARVGDGRLVPPRLQEPAPPRQRPADLRRLHAVHAVQPDRRQRRSPTTT